MIDEKILIKEIQEHAEKVDGAVSSGAVKDGYLLAHEHIVDIIHILADATKPVVPVDSSSNVARCKYCAHCEKDLFSFVCHKLAKTVKENDVCINWKWKD